MENRLFNCKNPSQGKFKKVLCVCSAGLLRSPTAAVVLSRPPFDFNTRACGAVREFALIPLDMVLVEWADEIVCMEESIAEQLRDKFREKRIICLDIEDNYGYRDERLMALVAERYQEKSK